MNEKHSTIRVGKGHQQSTTHHKQWSRERRINICNGRDKTEHTIGRGRIQIGSGNVIKSCHKISNKYYRTNATFCNVALWFSLFCILDGCLRKHPRLWAANAFKLFALYLLHISHFKPVERTGAQ